MSEDDVKQLFCDFIREICVPVFNHGEQEYYIQIDESAFLEFEAKLEKTINKG